MLIVSIAIGAEYLSNVKSIATFALKYFGYIISVLASVKPKQNRTITDRIITPLSALVKTDHTIYMYHTNTMLMQAC